MNQTIRFAPYALFATLALAAACSSDDEVEAPAPHATGGIAGASGHTSVGGKATGGKASGGGGASSNTGGTVTTAGSTSTGGATVGSGGAATGGTTPTQGGSSGASGSPSGGTPTGGAPPSAGAGGSSAGATTVAGSPSAGASGTTTVAGTTSVAGSTSPAGAAGVGVGGAAGGVAGSAAAAGVAGLSGGGTAGVAGGTGTGAVPGWTCPASSYGTADGCDCGCGVVDQDCIDLATSFEETDGNTKGYCQSFQLPDSCVPPTTAEPVLAIQSDDNSQCLLTAPPGWTCGLNYYGDSVCDCGCGVPDTDCSAGSSCSTPIRDGACSMNDDNTVISSTNRGLCAISAPTGWTCSLKAYGDGTCDYGCGVTDAASDCPNGATPRCDSAGACSRYVGCTAVSTEDQSKCVAGTWTCALNKRGNGVCDCGCGAPDVNSTGRNDCYTGMSKACGTCGISGSCARNCQDIDPLDNTRCD